jgi:excisionase family DNA binding protein
MVSEIEQAARRAVQLYAESRPRPSQVTMVQAAEMLGLGRHTVSKMVHAGQMKLNRCGLIPIEQVDRMLQSD